MADDAHDGLLFRAHPWHGVSIGEHAPDALNAAREIAEVYSCEEAREDYNVHYAEQAETL